MLGSENKEYLIKMGKCSWARNQGEYFLHMFIQKALIEFGIPATTKGHRNKAEVLVFLVPIKFQPGVRETRETVKFNIF